MPHLSSAGWKLRAPLAIASQELREGGAAGRELLVRNAIQGYRARFVEVVKLVAHVLVDVDETGDVFAVLQLLLDEAVSGAPVGRIVARAELAQHHAAAVVQLHRQRLAFRIIDRDLLRRGT